YFRLLLAILVGLALLLVSERRLRDRELAGRALRVVFWTAAAMGVTAVLTSLLAVGVFGESAIAAVNDIPGVFRVSKPAYLTSGFLALTNWHQDPGYGASWATLWAALAFLASLKGLGSGRRWLDGIVLGGLGFWVVMAFSRTGWLAYPIALLAASFLMSRRGGIRWSEIAVRLGSAALTIALLVGGVFALDPENVGGDLDLQFAFRLSQGWDLLADLTGLFERSDSTAFADRFDMSEQRADVWPEYLDMFRENPVLGVGLGVGWETNSIRQEPHNLVLELLAETGVVGAVTFAVLLAVILVVGSGLMGVLAVFAAFLPAMTQTVLFEPAWWFAAALFVAGVGVGEGPKELSEVRLVVE
ncbi:MAG: O-antigen ligase family protein, partial [Acidimicrobiia bacterium]|nr:O-antigen ligase family protein [Acidimicrobiia bacterium]